MHAASVSPTMITFFGIVQRIYMFFANSTSRWNALMSVLKVSLKAYTDTRWSSRANAVKALHSQIKEIYGILNDMVQTDKSVHCSEITSILSQINYNFLCTLSIWNIILCQVERVNKALQAKNITVLQGSQLIKGLKLYLEEMRENNIQYIYENVRK